MLDRLALLLCWTLGAIVITLAVVAESLLAPPHILVAAAVEALKTK